VIGWDEDTPPLLLWLPLSDRIVSNAVWMSEVVIAPDPVNGGDSRHPARRTHLPAARPGIWLPETLVLMGKLPGNQIEHKLFGFLSSQLHRHFV
jgi:hypothetical protein